MLLLSIVVFNSRDCCENLWFPVYRYRYLCSVVIGLKHLNIVTYGHSQLYNAKQRNDGVKNYKNCKIIPLESYAIYGMYVFKNCWWKGHISEQKLCICTYVHIYVTTYVAWCATKIIYKGVAN